MEVQIKNKKYIFSCIYDFIKVNILFYQTVQITLIVTKYSNVSLYACF